MKQMGFIMSAIGFGGFVGQLLLPAISDRLGRKPVAIGASIISIIVIFLFINTSSSPVLLFALLFIIATCVFGFLCLLAGPITTESVPPALIASVAGLPIGVGEIFGGGIMPSFAGYIAQNYGIENTLYIALFGLIACFVISLFIKETAPSKIKNNIDYSIKPDLVENKI